ncbi:hypothetical protein [Methanoculleus chikugoensis]|uniref:hypothetical protein n=1 Tax=Methanoculleus chikugoensis TaxID=118126 RepID=UPI000A75FB71|nr:hypothetical protein [Methanoculleus chikugoensis]
MKIVVSVENAAAIDEVTGGYNPTFIEIRLDRMEGGICWTRFMRSGRRPIFR